MIASPRQYVTRHADRPCDPGGSVGRRELAQRLRNPQTLAEWAAVCKGFRVVIRELLDELGRNDYTVRECKRCGDIKEHSPKGRYCRECWRKYDRQREIDYKLATWTRPRVNGQKRVYVRKEISDE